MGSGSTALSLPHVVRNFLLQSSKLCHVGTFMLVTPTKQMHAGMTKQMQGKKTKQMQGCLQIKRISALTHVLTSSFPQSMIARLVLNLLKSRDTVAMFQWSIAFDAFPLWHSRIFLNV